jgi:hypothetical protein
MRNLLWNSKRLFKKHKNFSSQFRNWNDRYSMLAHHHHHLNRFYFYFTKLLCKSMVEIIFKLVEKLKLMLLNFSESKWITKTETIFFERINLFTILSWLSRSWISSIKRDDLPGNNRATDEKWKRDDKWNEWMRKNRSNLLNNAWLENICSCLFFI